MLSSCLVAFSRSLRLEIQTVQRLCCIIDTPRSLTVALLTQYGEWEQLVDLSIDPSLYEDISNFADDYLVTEMLKKSPNLPLGIDTADVAYFAFFDAELRCYFTNERVMDVTSITPDWHTAYRARIRNMLGPLDGKALEIIEHNFSFGPGASTGVRGRGSVKSDKFDEPLHLTANLIHFVRPILGDTWWEHQRGTKTVVKGNRFTTVPKNAKTDRGIAVEPTLNMYVQKGIGKYIKKRLLYSGIDLSQQANNQSLAQRAYRDGLATIDIAQASDSLAWGVILEFFPNDWQELIFLARSEYTETPDGEFHPLEKLSSMGNGYTFELETLVFSALAFTIVPREEWADVSVYGDDIIVPQAHAHKMIDALNFLGFRVNGSKSFLAGNFFESCGADYFKGVNVRPFYLRGKGDSNIPYALQIANSLRLYSKRRAILGCDSRFKSIWLDLVKVIPSSWRKVRVPFTFGDSGLITSERECLVTRPAEAGHEGYMIKHMKIASRLRRSVTIGALLCNLTRKDQDGVERWIFNLPSNPRDAANGVYPWVLEHSRHEPFAAGFSYGRMAVRGFLLNPVTRWTTINEWPSGWDWI